MIRELTKLENWPTLGEYNSVYTHRKFAAYFIDVFWFNMVIVFFLVRFGPAAMHQQLEVCSGQDVRAIPFDENSTVAALQFTPHQESMFGGLIDLLYVRLWLQEAKNTMPDMRQSIQHRPKRHILG